MNVMTLNHFLFNIVCLVGVTKQSRALLFIYIIDNTSTSDQSYITKNAYVSLLLYIHSFNITTSLCNELSILCFDDLISLFYPLAPNF